MVGQRPPLKRVDSGFVGSLYQPWHHQCVHCHSTQETGKQFGKPWPSAPRVDVAVARRRRQRPVISAVLGGSVGAVTASQAAAGHHISLVIGTGVPTTVLAWFGGPGAHAVGDPNGLNPSAPLVWALGALAGLAVSHVAQQPPASLRKAWLRITRGTEPRDAQTNCPACEGEGTIECLCQRWSLPSTSDSSTKGKQSTTVVARGAAQGLFSKGRVRVSTVKANCTRCRGTGRERCPRCGGGGTLVHSDEASLRGDAVPVHLDDGYDWDRAARLKRDWR